MREDKSTSASDFKRDLAAAAALERERFGPPPSEGDLKALHDGRLDEKAAEELRDYLAVHPDWAQAYLEMFSSEDPAADDGESDPVDQISRMKAWRLLESRIREEAAPEKQTPRRLAKWLPLAAILLLAIGGAFLMQTEWARPQDSHRIDVLASSRGSRVEVPRSVANVEIVTSLQGHELDGRYEIVIRTQNGVVLSQERDISPNQEQLSWTVPAAKLLEFVNHRLEARPLDGSPMVPLGRFEPHYID